MVMKTFHKHKSNRLLSGWRGFGTKPETNHGCKRCHGLLMTTTRRWSHWSSLGMGLQHLELVKAGPDQWKHLLLCHCWGRYLPSMQPLSWPCCGSTWRLKRWWRKLGLFWYGLWMPCKVVAILKGPGMEYCFLREVQRGQRQILLWLGATKLQWWCYKLTWSL